MQRAELLELNTRALMELYRRMENDLLRNIAGHLQLREAGDPERWLIQKLIELGQLNTDNIQTIAKYSRHTSAEVARTIERVSGAVLQQHETLYTQAFNKGMLARIPLPIEASPTMQHILQSAVKNGQNWLNLVNTTALQTSEQAFLSAVNQAYLETITGTINHRDAIAKAVRKLGDQGIKGSSYISKNGRRTYNTIDVAVRRAVLTSTTQATGKAQIDRALDWGADLVEVSSHASARPSHAEWQGKIYSLTGKDRRYPNFYTATDYGSITGLHGANCGHDFYPYFPGISTQRFETYDKATTNERYETKQEQRKLEREMRAAERQRITTQAAGDHEGAAAASERVQAADKALIDFIDRTGFTRRYDREDSMVY